MIIKGEGMTRVNANGSRKKRSINLENTQLVPNPRTNLVSVSNVSRITKHGFKVI